MSSLVAKIKDIEDEMARTQINKQTMAHICGLRAKLAKYKRELLFDGPKSGAQGAGEGFDVKATGDARVGLVGFPSVGKSTLLTSLTGISSADLNPSPSPDPDPDPLTLTRTPPPPPHPHQASSPRRRRTSSPPSRASPA